MKVNWFHLMPYRFLPPDFEEKYRSVWVDPPIHLFDPVKAHQLYNEYLDELEFADEVGFDGICVNEHHNNAYGIMPSPNLMAAMLARRTSNAALIVLGNSPALYNPPIRVAEEFAMLDCTSGGRLVAGLPVGTSMDTNFAYGQNPATLREKYYEAHDLIIKAWTEPEPFAFNGKHNQVRYVNIWPRPLQQPHPPVWVPGGGSVETWEWTARMDYVYCYLSYSGYKRGIQVMDGFWKEMDRLGYDDNPYRAGFLQLVCVSETDQKAEEEYAEHVDLLLQEVPPRVRRICGRSRLSYRQDHQDRRHRAGRRSGLAQAQGPQVAGLRRRGLHHRGEPRNRGQEPEVGRRGSSRWPAHGLAPDRQHAEEPHHEEHRAFRERGPAPRQRYVERVREPVVAHTP